MMTLEALLNTLEPLTYTARIQHMIELGRQANQDNDVAALLSSMEQGDLYVRYLALFACFGRKRGEYVLQALTDPSCLIRRQALSLVALACNEEQMSRALDLVPESSRRALLWKLSNRSQQAVTDDYLSRLARQSESQLCRYLHMGSQEIINCYRLQFQQQSDLVNWIRMARLHPQWVVQLLQERVEATTSEDLQLLHLVNIILPVLTKQRIIQTLILVRVLLRLFPLSHLALQSLVSIWPTELADIVLQAEEHATLSFDKVARKLDVSHLQQLLEQRYLRPPLSPPAVGWFHRLTPEQRLALYNTYADGLHHADGHITLEVIEVLPAAQREQEGRRHLALESLVTMPEARLPYAAFLPWDEARRLLEPFLQQPDANLRSVVLNTLGVAVRYQRQHITELLNIFRARRYEQDPVRHVMLRSLATLPRSIWRLEHLPHLSQIFRDAFDATDASYSSIATVAELIARCVSIAPEWAAQQFAVLMQEYHYDLGTFIRDVLTDEEMRQLTSGLPPVLKAWETSEDETAFQRLLSFLGRHFRIFEELVEQLEKRLLVTRNRNLASVALEQIITYWPQRAALLIPLLLNEDQSYIVIPEVLHYLHRYRQDLLTPLLGQSAFEGRFTTGKTRYVLPLSDHFMRWTPMQQMLFSHIVIEVIDDPKRDQYAILFAMRQLAALHMLPQAKLVTLASDLRPFVRDTALRLLGGLDDAAQGLPTLLEALNDDRARIAIVVLRHYFKTAPLTSSLALLRSLPLEKIRVAKEVIRILSELPGEEAYQELLRIEGQDLHRDVRVALLRALWGHLDRQETWEILQRHAALPDATLALSSAMMSLANEALKHSRAYNPHFYRGPIYYRKQKVQRGIIWRQLNLSRRSMMGLNLREQEQVMQLYVTLLKHPLLEVKATVLRDCTRVAVADLAGQLLSLLLEALESSTYDICQSVASTIFSSCLAEEAAIIRESITRLLPHRRALYTTIQVLITASVSRRPVLLPVIRTVLEALSTDPLTLEWQVELVITTLPWEEVVPWLEEQIVTERMHADAYQQTCRLLSEALPSSSRNDPSELAQVEARLAASPDARLRRLAFSLLLAQCEPPQGWTPALRARLQHYCQDDSALVAAVAQFTFPPE